MAQPASRGSRIAYLRYLERRAIDEGDEAEYKALRRGWCLGSAEFKSELSDGLNEQLNSLKRDSTLGETRRMHDQFEAERILQEGAELVELKLSEKDVLKKNDPRKELIAWVLTKKTSVGQEWIAQQLGMGNRVNVSRAIRSIEKTTDETERKMKLAEMFNCLH